MSLDNFQVSSKGISVYGIKAGQGRVKILISVKSY